MLMPQALGDPYNHLLMLQSLHIEATKSKRIELRSGSRFALEPD